jgi:hypothetical protein
MNKNGRKPGATNKPRVILREHPDRIARIIEAVREWVDTDEPTTDQVVEARAASRAMVGICQRALRKTESTYGY